MIARHPSRRSFLETAGKGALGALGIGVAEKLADLMPEARAEGREWEPPRVYYNVLESMVNTWKNREAHKGHQPTVAELKAKDRELQTLLNEKIGKVLERKYGFRETAVVASFKEVEAWINRYGLTHNDLKNLLKQNCVARGIPYRLALGVVGIEFDPRHPISSAGAVGIMQVMPESKQARGLSTAQLLDPRFGIPAGVLELSEKYEYWNDERRDERHYDLMLMAYNMGTAKVKQIMYADRNFPESGITLASAKNVPRPALLAKVRQQGITASGLTYIDGRGNLHPGDSYVMSVVALASLVEDYVDNGPGGPYRLWPGATWRTAEDAAKRKRHR